MMNVMNARELVEKLALLPHPEGGWYRAWSAGMERHVLGDVRNADATVAVIPAGVWQAARTLGEYSLVGCTVGPGFEFDDFRFVAGLQGHGAHFTGELARYAALL